MPNLLKSNSGVSEYTREVLLRIERLQQLEARVAPVPDEWLEAGKREARGHGKIESTRCTSWDEVEECWRNAQRWRQGMGDVLSVMLAVVASTSQIGNQLFLQVIADAGSAKTQMADAMLVSKHCHVLEHLTGFHSGKKGEDGKNLSLLNRINHKTLITPEGDVLVASPLFPELMAQARRIFDGKSSATYKTDDEDMTWEGLRTPWIICGTPFMTGYWDQSRLGDRFLRVWLESPGQEERRRIVHAAMMSEWEAVEEHSNGTTGGVEKKLRHAYSLTGGFVDHLRETVGSSIARVTMSAKVGEQISDLAEWVADVRARPNTDIRRVETHDTKELPTRIGRQLVRLARCLAVVLGRSEVDSEVLRRVRKVAMDSGAGKTADLLRWFHAIDSRTGVSYQQGDGLMSGSLARWCGVGDENKLLQYLGFLQKIDVVEHVDKAQSNGTWKLTQRVEQLYRSMRLYC